jgi:effector-binding domain-containing protein
MASEPRVEYREAQPYIGIRMQVPIRRLGKVIPQLTGEVFAWLETHDLTPAGAPFIRYHVIDMERLLDVEIGVPVLTAPPGDGRANPGVLPAGRYASLVYRGVKNGIKGNAALLDWGAANGLAWDMWNTEQGDAFGSRYESFLTDPEEEPDPSKWDTEVAIRLAD